MRLTRQGAVAIALGCGAVAAILAYAYLKRMSATPEVRPAPVSVVVAREDIATQTIISPTSLDEESLTPDKVPPDAVSDPADIVGMVALTKIPAGKPIRRGQVSQRSAELGLTYVVPTGMRAVTVQTDPVSGVAGFLKPGNHVDVLATFEVGRESVARTILQDILLLAIGTEAAPPEEQAAQRQPGAEKTGDAKAPEPAKKAPPDQKTQATATLAVTPMDAQRLILAATKGTIRLTLRPANEHEYVQMAPIDGFDVIGRRPPEVNPPVGGPGAQPAAAKEQIAPSKPSAPAPAAAAAPAQSGATRPAPAKPSVEVFRGTQRETVTP